MARSTGAEPARRYGVHPSVANAWRILLLAAALLPVAAAAQDDPWGPLRPLLGRWQGTGDGMGGPAEVEHSYELVLQERFVHMRTRSVSRPAAGEAAGELHEDWGMFSHDADRDRLVWRQFLTEGFVNTYVLEPSEEGDGRQVWTSESTEGAGGMGARISIELVGDDEYSMLLELRPPGGEFFDCRTMRMRRVEGPAALSPTAREAAEHAVSAYGEEAIATLADLVGFRSVHVEGTDNATNPEFRAMTDYLAGKAAALGLDFSDHGAVVLIGLGEAPERVGIIAHADVQPADPSKWASDPFTLDVASESGRLIGRGAEDDKGPLATALYAMKAVADTGRPMTRRIELIVSYTEESDWGPFQEFLAGYDPPAINFALDAVYPVVTAEKGWGEIHLMLRSDPEVAPPPGSLVSISGGSFLSQVPEDAEARIATAGAELEAVLRAMVAGEHPVTYTVERHGEDLVVRCRGVSAHSMDPWAGRNAITHLADLLGRLDWPDTAAARMVRWIDDLVGTGDFAEKFGDLAYEHEFMGPLTLTLATVVAEEDRITANLSFRRPAGRSAEEVEGAIRAAVDGWKVRTGTEELALMTKVLDPYLLEDAPHVATLLEVFRHYTGIEEAGPVAIGGGTNARLLPNGVSFGPSMPGETYTGHSEHEFITRDQLLLDLKMYTAALAELSLR